MAGRTAAKRTRLFDLYVNQPGYQDLTQGEFFWCPLCRQPFSRSQLVGNPAELTLAHIIPECQGGTWKTLCCRKCNNGNGQKIEIDFLTSQQMRDWAKGSGEIKIRMGEVKAIMRRDPTAKRLDIQIVTPEENPAVPAFRARLEDLLTSLDSDRTITLTTPWFRPNWCKAAICQSAYLLMFKFFGYDFARCGTYNDIREQVVNPDIEQQRLRIVGLHPLIGEEFLNGQQAAVIFLREPIFAILPVMRFRSPGMADQILTVAMPGPYEPPLSEWELKRAVYSPVADESEKVGSWMSTFAEEWHHWRNVTTI